MSTLFFFFSEGKILCWVIKLYSLLSPAIGQYNKSVSSAPAKWSTLFRAGIKPITLYCYHSRWQLNWCFGLCHEDHSCYLYLLVVSLTKTFIWDNICTFFIPFISILHWTVLQTGSCWCSCSAIHKFYFKGGGWQSCQIHTRMSHKSKTGFSNNSSRSEDFGASSEYR